MFRTFTKRTGITAGLLAVLAASTLTGCAESDEPEYVAVCADPISEERVDDSLCTSDAEYVEGDTGYFWYYIAAAAMIPAVGADIDLDDGTFKASKLGKKVKVLRGGLPTSGGTSYKSYKKTTTSNSTTGKSSTGSTGGSSKSSGGSSSSTKRR